MERRKEERKKGRKDRRKEGRKAGRQARKTEGRKGRKERRNKGMTEGKMERKMERKIERKRTKDIFVQKLDNNIVLQYCTILSYHIKSFLRLQGPWKRRISPCSWHLGAWEDRVRPIQ